MEENFNFNFDFHFESKLDFEFKLDSDFISQIIQFTEWLHKLFYDLLSYNIRLSIHLHLTQNPRLKKQ